MYLGPVVELGPVEEIFDAAAASVHAGAAGVAAVDGPGARIEEPPLTGDPPSPIDPPVGLPVPHPLPVRRAGVRGARRRCSATWQDRALPCRGVPHARPRIPATARAGGCRDGRPCTDGRPRRLLEVRDLTVRFVTREATVHAVNGVTFSVRPARCCASWANPARARRHAARADAAAAAAQRRSLVGLRVDGQDVLALQSNGVAAICAAALVAMIFQEPMTALDPVYTIGQQIVETIRRHKGGTKAAARARALELLELVKIPSAARRLDDYPHELSGGLRQRAMIAMALSCGPRLLLADEPTTALDATVQIQVLILLRRLQQELGMGTIFVTHDLGVAAEIADRIAVMYAGRIVEEGPVADVLRAPLHPYTAGLLASTVHGQAPRPRYRRDPGQPARSAARCRRGCSFAPRCGLAIPPCRPAVPDPSPRAWAYGPLPPCRGRVARSAKRARMKDNGA